MPAFSIYQPAPAYLANGSSELDDSDDGFTGANRFRGVNPANGVVFYYNLPELKKSDEVTLEIRDAGGVVVNSFSTKPDANYRKWDGGPDEDPTLSKGKGLNRFVWNMRHATLPGVPGVYIESSYAGHKAPPGKYTATLKMGGQTVAAAFEILSNPLYPTTAAEYSEYHKLMLAMESDLTTMHRMVNSLYAKQRQLSSILNSLPTGDKYAAIRKTGEELVKKLKAWDEEMIQRKSKAYDDVENFPNKFTANYLFLINQTESDIPRVNQPSLDRLAELNRQWAGLRSMANDMNDKELPALNKMLWDAGIGAVWEK